MIPIQYVETERWRQKDIQRVYLSVSIFLPQILQPQIVEKVTLCVSTFTW